MGRFLKAAEWAANTIHESINQPEYPMDMLNPSEKVKAYNPLYGFKVSSELIMKLIKTCDNRITPLLVQEQTKDRTNNRYKHIDERRN